MVSFPEYDRTGRRVKCADQRVDNMSSSRYIGMYAHTTSPQNFGRHPSRIGRKTDNTGVSTHAMLTNVQGPGKVDESFSGGGNGRARYSCAVSKWPPCAVRTYVLPGLLFLCVVVAGYDNPPRLGKRVPPASQLLLAWFDNRTQHTDNITAGLLQQQSGDTNTQYRSEKYPPDARISPKPILTQLSQDARHRYHPLKSNSVLRYRRNLNKHGTNNGDLEADEPSLDLFLDYSNRSDELALSEDKLDLDMLFELHVRAMQSSCEAKWSNFTQQLQDDGQLYCNSTFDRVLCWPTTLAGELAIQSCPLYFADIKYRKGGNSSKVCFPNGTWEPKTDYNDCAPELDDPVNMHNFIVRWLYYVGFTVSIVSCVVALFIFLYFKALRCVRNKIHCHLIVTFVLRNFLWLIMNNTFPIIMNDDDKIANQIVCKSVVALFNYAQVTNFFWMLVEGLYLHKMIVWAFSVDRIKFWWYIAIGWGLPALIVLVWVIVKIQLQDNPCWLPETELDWDFEYIYIVPVLLVLLINVVFLISIVVVLITKLRASNTVLARQYKKAVKATVILLPLLGGTYILFICSPGEEKLVSNLIFIYFNTILQSTQGLAVTTFYCFLNGEVRSTIRSRWNRWQEGRSFSTRYTRDTRGSMATTNGETIGLRTSFRGTNDISNVPNETVIKNTTKNNNHVADVPEGVLIHTCPVGDAGDDSEGDSQDNIDNTVNEAREITCLQPLSSVNNTNI